MPTNTAKVEASYHFLVASEAAGGEFSMTDLCTATGWKPKTPGSYLSKKWAGLVQRKGDRYTVRGVAALSLEQYLARMSQVARNEDATADDGLAPQVEVLVRKAQQAAILALDVYNRPGTRFRTEGFSMLMVVAWTSLLHATFERRGIDYAYKDDCGDAITADGEPKTWELKECVKRYYAGNITPVTKNLEFMVLLRNKVEHRYVPSLDPHVAGECHAMLRNFESVMLKEFGEAFAVGQTLCPPMYPTGALLPEQASALKAFQANEYDELKDFIDGYRDALDDSVYTSPEFSFRVYLVPKVGNHRSSSDIAFEFVKFDPNDVDALQEIDRQIVAIRTREVPVANQGKYLPGAVVRRVQQRLGPGILFGTYQHTRCWRAYGVRTPGPASPGGCDNKYCQYDAAHDGYIYTGEWVEFLVENLSDPAEYARVMSQRA